MQLVISSDNISEEVISWSVCKGKKIYLIKLCVPCYCKYNLKFERWMKKMLILKTKNVLKIICISHIFTCSRLAWKYSGQSENILD